MRLERHFGGLFLVMGAAGAVAAIGAAIGAAGVSPAAKALAAVKLTARARAVNSGLRMIMGKHLGYGIKGLEIAVRSSDSAGLIQPRQ